MDAVDAHEPAVFVRQPAVLDSLQMLEESGGNRPGSGCVAHGNRHATLEMESANAGDYSGCPAGDGFGDLSALEALLQFLQRIGRSEEHTSELPSPMYLV